MTPHIVLISGLVWLSTASAAAAVSVAQPSDRERTTAPSTQPARPKHDPSLDCMRQRLDAWRDRLERSRPPRPPMNRFSVPVPPPTVRVPSPFSPGLPRRPDAIDPRFGRDPMPGWTPPPGSVPWDFDGARYWVVPLHDSRDARR